MYRNTVESKGQWVGTANLTDGERYSLLSSERRRTVLDVLEEQTADIQLTELAFEVANQEAGLDAEDSETVMRIKTTLHHNHLPKMDALGVLTYDPDSHRIRL